MKWIPWVATALVLAACSSNQRTSQRVASSAATAPSATTAEAQLSSSPRHGEWVFVKTADNDSVRAWLVYPERKTKAPVVVVVHEVFGLSNWVRSVADQLAANGFIAIAPDLLTSFHLPDTAEGETNPDSARAHIGQLQPAQMQMQIRRVAEYAMNLPAATKHYGVVGFCWGGGIVFAHAVSYSDVGAIVSYYGITPAPADYAKLKAPVLGLYGENDARVDATIARADSGTKANHTVYEHHIFPGAGHGFLRAQDGQNGANLKAAEQAWPLTVAWFKKYL